MRSSMEAVDSTSAVLCSKVLAGISSGKQSSQNNMTNISNKGFQRWYRSSNASSLPVGGLQ